MRVSCIIPTALECVRQPRPPQGCSSANEPTAESHLGGLLEGEGTFPPPQASGPTQTSAGTSRLDPGRRSGFNGACCHWTSHSRVQPPYPSCPITTSFLLPPVLLHPPHRPYSGLLQCGGCLCAITVQTIERFVTCPCLRRQNVFFCSNMQR